MWEGQTPAFIIGQFGFGAESGRRFIEGERLENVVTDAG